MVLAKIISEHQRAAGFQAGVEEGFQEGSKQGFQEGSKQGFQEGVERERKRKNARIRALAKKYGIPEDELPIEDEDE